jgi:hypothetical protein
MQPAPSDCRLLLFFSPRTLIQIWKHYGAVSRIDAFHTRAAIGTKRPLNFRAVWRFDEILFTRDGLSLFIEQFDFDPRWLIRVDDFCFFLFFSGRTCRAR